MTEISSTGNNISGVRDSEGSYHLYVRYPGEFQKKIIMTDMKFKELSKRIQNNETLSSQEKAEFTQCLKIELETYIRESRKSLENHSNTKITALYQTLRQIGFRCDTAGRILTDMNFFDIIRDLEKILGPLKETVRPDGEFTPNCHQIAHFNTVIRFLEQDTSSSAATTGISSSSSGKSQSTETAPLMTLFKQEEKNIYDENVLFDSFVEKIIKQLLKKVFEKIRSTENKEEKIKQETIVFRSLLTLGIKDPSIIAQFLISPNESNQEEIRSQLNAWDNICVNLSKQQINYEGRTKSPNDINIHQELSNLLRELSVKSSVRVSQPGPSPKIANYQDGLSWLRGLDPKTRSSTNNQILRSLKQEYNRVLNRDSSKCKHRNIDDFVEQAKNNNEKYHHKAYRLFDFSSRKYLGNSNQAIESVFNQYKQNEERPLLKP